MPQFQIQTYNRLCPLHEYAVFIYTSQGTDTYVQANGQGCLWVPCLRHILFAPTEFLQRPALFVCKLYMNWNEAWLSDAMETRIDAPFIMSRIDISPRPVFVW